VDVLEERIEIMRSECDQHSRDLTRARSEVSETRDDLRTCNRSVRGLDGQLKGLRKANRRQATRISEMEQELS